MKTRIPIYLDDQAYKALKELAREDYRDVRGEASILVRTALEQRGLLAVDPEQAKNVQQAEGARDEQ